MTKDERILILWNRIMRVDKALSKVVVKGAKQQKHFNETRDDLVSITRDLHVLIGD